MRTLFKLSGFIGAIIGGNIMGSTEGLNLVGCTIFSIGMVLYGENYKG